jgi:hypothetical protein
MDKTIEQYFIEHRQGMGYTDEQIQAELLVKQTGFVKHMLPSTSRSSYTSDEAWERGVKMHQELARDLNSRGIETGEVTNA